MTPSEYLAAIRREGDALLTAARAGLDRPVWSCPGWNVRDVVAHTGVVHRHKEELVRRRMRSGQPDRPTAPHGDGDLLAWYAEGLDLLVDTLKSTDPETPVFTWHPPDQTAGFWYRRLAHETTVHRVDAELGHGEPGPVETPLAADGVDEILAVHITPFTRFAKLHDGGEIVVMRCTDCEREWLLRLAERDGWRFERTVGDVEADAEIRGGAADVYLYLWGRAPLERLVIAGDELVVERVREVAAEAGS
jgi:uncharacterized protein (TIGR03083 family)